MTVPTEDWDEAVPAGSDNISAGDDKIRQLKTQVREVVGVDHDFPSSGKDAGNGQHLQVTLQEQADIGTGAVNATILGSQTVSGKGELMFTDEDDNDVQITSGGSLDATSLAGVYPAADVAAVATIAALLMPVGSIYANAAVSTNPATLLGFGTWVAIEGQCVVGLVAGGEFDTLGAVPEGETTHLLTAAESGVPAHTHAFEVTSTNTGGTNQIPTDGNSASSHTTTVNANSTANAASAHNNIQPSYVAYVWRRTV